jgi:hypothetical protein
MGSEKTNVSRKKFLFWGIGITSLFTIPAFLRRSKKASQPKTVKMLTQDGRLVEVDIEKLSSKKEKIRAEDIHTWVDKKHGSF